MTNALSSVPSSFAPSADLADVLGQLLTDDIACTHDAVVLVDQGGVRIFNRSLFYLNLTSS
jgi:hypothetical protein